MKKLTYHIIAATLLFTGVSCNNQSHDDHHDHGGHDHGESSEIVLTDAQQKAIDLKTGPIEKINMSAGIEVNGELELPPKYKAFISTYIGGNIKDIYVIEGNAVEKGKTLATLEHPDLLQLQSDFQESHSQLQYLQKEYARQKTLYENEVASGKEFQKTEADYFSTKSHYNTLKSKLEMLNLNTNRVLKGETYRYVPIITPISGHVRRINAAIGQYIQPQQEIFEVINNDHIHANLLVFEKDINKVKEGQKVSLKIDALPGRTINAHVYALGKAFESEPKAIHVHAEIDNQSKDLIPGMYVRGIISTDTNMTLAVPEDAIVNEKGSHYIYIKKGTKEVHLDTPDGHGHAEGRIFEPVAVIPSTKNNGYVSITPMDELPENAEIALNKAYYLLSEQTKSEAGHGHSH